MPDTHTGPVPPGRVLAIDPGERWIGLALSDDDQRLALPNTTIDRRTLPAATAALAAALADAITRAISPDQPVLLVVGLPLRPDGTEDAQAASFRDLGARLAAALGIPLALQEERHSNRSLLPLAAPPPVRHGRDGRRPGALSPTRRKREREQRHAAAAATILQRWLDARHAPQPLPPATDPDA